MSRIIITVYSFLSSFASITMLSPSKSLIRLKQGSNGFDLRGVLEEGMLGPHLNNEMAFWVGFGFGAMLKKKRPNERVKVGIGRDPRQSGIKLTEWLMCGLETANVEAYDVGLCTTPAMFYCCCPEILSSQNSEGPWPFDGGISVTASHLPNIWNGFKLFTSSTPSNIGSEGIDCLINEVILAEDSGILPAPISMIDKRICPPFLPEYSKFLQENLKKFCPQDDQGTPILFGLRLCINAGNGAGGFLAEALRALGADVSSSIHLEPDGSFPNHIPNPEDKEAILATQEAVIVGGAELGICLDTDADRCGIVDKNGRLLNRNGLVALVSRIAISAARKSTRVATKEVVVTDSSTSNGITRYNT